MKHLTLLLCLLIGICTNAQNIEQRIEAAFNEALAENSTQKIDDLLKNQASLTNYWKAYALLKKSILLATQKDNKQEEKTIALAIETLEDIENKNSEDWALLAYCRNYDMRFATAFTIPFRAMKITEACENAEKLDTANPRAFLTKGILDAHTPEMYGGKQKTEQYFLQAIKLYEQKNNRAVVWGYEIAYSNLIVFYYNNNQKEKAKLWFYKGLAIFPESNWFKTQQSKGTYK